MADLADIAAGWDQAAKDDAMFNILTCPGKAKGQGGWDTDEFFEHGDAEVAPVLKRMKALGLNFDRNRALDFGCGVGRLTQALSAHFRWVIGMDVSREMVRQAKVFAEERGCNHVGFRVNAQPNLNVFKGGNMNGFDFIYSAITLQHMPHEFQQAYVGEFVRLLRKRGVACFQIPDGGSLEQPNAWLSMYGTPRATVEGWVSEADGRVVDVEESSHTGNASWTDWRYTVEQA